MFLLVFLAGPRAVPQFLSSLLHMRLGHPSPGRATCGLVVLGFRAASPRREAALGPGRTFLSSGSASLAEHSAWFPGTKSRSTGVRFQWKREVQGVLGRTSVWSQAGVFPPACRPSSILAGAQSHSLPWCESHGHLEGGAWEVLFLFLPCPLLSRVFSL